MKGNSVCHYLIELISFILMNQDSSSPTAVLACMVDFSKAFNRQDHSILITKLSDMGVPGWLLKLVIAFLSNRKMHVRFKGLESSSRDLPGGGPQGTLLGLLLFLVLINDIGFENQKNNVGELVTVKRNMYQVNQIHLKYIDDLTIAESVDLKNLQVKPTDQRILPEDYHSRTGHTLNTDKSSVVKQIDAIQSYASNNKMKLNLKKTKMILFNPSKKYDFLPNVQIQENEIESVEEIKLLGVVLRSDMKWSSNTDLMAEKSYKRLWVLRRLKGLGSSDYDLLDIYMKQVRPVLEFAVPVWHSAITQGECELLERIQKSALKIILQERYKSYESSLAFFKIHSLKDRR